MLLCSQLGPGWDIDELSDVFHTRTAHTYLCGRTATKEEEVKLKKKKKKSLNWGPLGPAGRIVLLLLGGVVLPGSD